MHNTNASILGFYLALEPVYQQKKFNQITPPYFF